MSYSLVLLVDGGIDAADATTLTHVRPALTYRVSKPRVVSGWLLAAAVACCSAAAAAAAVVAVSNKGSSSSEATAAAAAAQLRQRWRLESESKN